MSIMNKLITYRQAINDAITQAMINDPSVFVFGLDVADHIRILGSTAGIVEKFGKERCFGTPLSEDAMTGVAIGAAINGLKPIHVHIRADFLQLSMNQIVNMASSLRYLTSGKLKIPLVIRALIGKGWGQGAQHSKTIHSLLAHIPGIKILMPTTPADVKGLFLSAINDNNPVIFLEHRWLYDTTGFVPNEDNFMIKIGDPNILKKGKDLTVVSVQWMNIEALKAAEILKKNHNIDIEIIDPRTIKPLDFDKIYESVNKTGHCLIADYDWLYSSFSAELAARISENCFGSLKSPIKRIGFAETPCPTSRPLEDLFYPNAINIIRTVEEILKLKKSNISNENFYSYENKFKGPF